MTCQDIQNLLPGYWENLLSPDERSLVESHLSFCHLCRRSLVDLNDSANLLNHLEEVEPPPFFEKRIMARVMEEAGKKRGFLRKFFFPIHIKIPLQAMATLLIAVLAAYIYQKNEPEMKPRNSLSVPFSESQKGPAKTESLKSPKPPETTKEAESLKFNKPTVAVTPSISDPGGNLHKKDESRFAAAPPAVDRERIGESVESVRPKEDEKLADEKSPLLKSAPAPLSSVSGKTENRTAIDLNLQVRDTSQSVRQIEERLSQAGARIFERTQGRGKALLKVEMAFPQFASFLYQLEEVGRVDFNKEALSVPVDRVTVHIHISQSP
jgi:hypothetical protein